MTEPTFSAQVRTFEERLFLPLDPSSYWLTRFLFLRLLGLIYSLAFFSLANQLGPLIGADGLVPAHLYIENLAAHFGGAWPAFLKAPTLCLWLGASDAALYALCYLGLVLSLLLLCGFSSVPHLLALWLLYMSLYQVGQLFYGYGWEILLLESGFLAIFLCPLLRGPTPPSTAVMWLYRWVLFRVVFGAGLIKVRGDACWLDLTCMYYHYETQPLPNPLSWYLHQLPPLAHKASTLVTHLVELVGPFFLFAPRGLRHVAGLVQIAFQGLLILSGNLSWLNYLTIALCVPCFDDQALRGLFPARLAARLEKHRGLPLGHGRRLAVYMLCALVFYLSIQPVRNMLSPHQAMNRSFDPLHLVNAYGAFGHIGKTRREIVLKGTRDAVGEDTAEWLEYEFKCKPGDPNRRPCMVSPYHYRLDWQIWFAAMSEYRHHPWLVHLLYKLLQGNQGALSLLGHNPFPEGPPTQIRADLYEYHFTTFADQTRAWWRRRRLGTYLGPLSADDPALLRFLDHYGWLSPAAPAP